MYLSNSTQTNRENGYKNGISKRKFRCEKCAKVFKSGKVFKVHKKGCKG